MTDHAGVAFHPPILVVAFLVLGFVLRAIAPLSFAPEQTVALIGSIIVVVSFAMFFWAITTMRRSGASIPTGEPTDTIVHSGPYRYSRNPIYVSMVGLLIGASVVLLPCWSRLVARGIIPAWSFLAVLSQEGKRNLSTTMGHSTGLIREQCPVW